MRNIKKVLQTTITNVLSVIWILAVSLWKGSSGVEHTVEARGAGCAIHPPSTILLGIEPGVGVVPWKH